MFRGSPATAAATIRIQIVLDSRLQILQCYRKPHRLLWPQATTFERSQRGCLQPGAIIVRFGQRPQQLKDHREAIGCHSLLWPAATTIEESQDQRMSAPCTVVPVSCSQRIIAPV